jgi:nucleoside-diphosphate-sugar epimerase
MAIRGHAENRDMCPTLSTYAVSKKAAKILPVFTRHYGLETVSLRYFNFSGPRQEAESQ